MAKKDDIGILKALVHNLLAEVERLKEQVHELEVEKADLHARQAQTSANSHKPASAEASSAQKAWWPGRPYGSETGNGRAA
jgi:cell division septum initiation protein DivIVA